MTKTISASQAKTGFGTLISLSTKRGDEFIVESYGEPKVAIIPFAEYQRVDKWRRQAERQEIWTKLESLRERVQKRRPKLTAKEADRLANRFTREVVEEMVKEKKIAFK